MKIFKNLSLLVMITATLFSCDELDELTEFDITEDFNTTFNITAADEGEGGPATFSSTSSIDLASNQDIQDNLDLLQDVTLNSLTYEISNYDGPEGALVTQASITLGTTVIAVTNIDLQQSDLDNMVYTIAETSQLNAIANALENNTAIDVSLSGTVDSTPVTFDVIVNLDVTVTVDAI